MALDRVVHGRVRERVDILTDRKWFVLLIAVLPVPLTMVFFIVHSIVTGTPREAYGLPLAYLIYGLANVVTVGVLYALLTAEEREAVFKFTRPSVAEVGWAGAAFVGGLGVYQLTSRISSVLGYELQGLSYSLTSLETIAIIVLGAVIIAPITEEILYRGLVLGTLLARGYGIVSAVTVMTLLFALIHLPNFGVAGTLFISVWGLLPAVLRLRFDNLTGAVLMHMLNNLFTYLIIVGLGLV
ncbi:lysostaphin resistance A-like protein [Halorubrum sp. AS12]|uniref:CPBP family intramembrane glutamic endopeptidase n=1 Tax=Halorubrum sp. AS12 TaxID=3409687 RepID=UPI003DA6E3AE